MNPNVSLTGSEHEVCFNGVMLPCNIIQTIDVEVSQDTTDVRSLCGLAYVKRAVPTATVTMTLIYKNMQLLKDLYPGLFNDGADPAADCGGLRIASNTCETQDTITAPLNIHPVCATDACNDITLWNADPTVNFTLNIAENTEETFEIVFNSLPAPALLADGVTANPRAGEIFWYGTPGLANGVAWDCANNDFA